MHDNGRLTATSSTADSSDAAIRWDGAAHGAAGREAGPGEGYLAAHEKGAHGDVAGPRTQNPASWLLQVLQICESATAADPGSALVSRRSGRRLILGSGRRPIRPRGFWVRLVATHRAGLCHHRGKAGQLTRQLVGSWVGSSKSKKRPS